VSKELDTESSATTPVSGQGVVGPLSNPQKITLFRSLFQGREDIFARRWENPRNGKTGYSPACLNDWKRGICQKLGSPGEKKRSGSVCGVCRQQAFIPVTDDEIAKHLKGIQVVGLYPLLVNETCWLLAVDFDKISWQDDALSFAERAQGKAYLSASSKPVR
jgi:hypothetical protein